MLRTMIVGSLPRPSWLAEPAQVYTAYRLEGEALREAQDDAVLLALRDQDIAGLDIATDGEQRRRHYIWGFCEGLEGLDFEHLVKLAPQVSPAWGIRRETLDGVLELASPGAQFRGGQCVHRVFRLARDGHR